MNCNRISGLLHLVPVHRVALVWLSLLPRVCLELVCLVLGLELLLWLVVHVPKGRARYAFCSFVINYLFPDSLSAYQLPVLYKCVCFFYRI